MKNIYFYAMKAGQMKMPDEVEGMLARDPVGSTLSSFGLLPTDDGRYSIDYALGGLFGEDVPRIAYEFRLQSAVRDIPRETLRAAIDEAIRAREDELGRDLNPDEEDGVRDAATIRLAEIAPIVKKTTSVLYYPGLDIVAVEATSREKSWHIMKFVARLFEPADPAAESAAAQEGRAAATVLDHFASRRPTDFMRQVVLNVDTGNSALDIGDSCQVKGVHTGTVYSVRKGDLGSKEARPFLENPNNEIQRLSLIAFMDNAPVVGDDRMPFAQFSLAKDGGLRSVKWFDMGADEDVQAAISEAEDPKRFMAAAYCWRLGSIYCWMLGIEESAWRDEA